YIATSSLGLAEAIICLQPSAAPFAYEIAQSLALPFDLFLMRRLPAPDHPGLTLGTIAYGWDGVLFNDAVVRGVDIPKDTLDDIISNEVTFQYSYQRPSPPINSNYFVIKRSELDAMFKQFYPQPTSSPFLSTLLSNPKLNTLLLVTDGFQTTQTP